MLQKLGKTYIFSISLKCRYGVNEQGLMTNYVHMGLQQRLQICSYLTTCSWTLIILIIMIISSKSSVINLCSDVPLRNDTRQMFFYK